MNEGRNLERCLWAPRAWLADGWAERVLLRIGSDGRWSSIEADVAVPPPDAQVLQGPALPGLVDAHSHAFQRAFAGLAERREAGREHDDFWSWRERMYAVARRITPAQLQAVAAQLYVELLRGGYTQVCEFHYLQHDGDGRPYADPLALSWALADAAAEAGIGLTLLPVLYERAGFGAAPLREEQRRFALDADGVWAACRRIDDAARPLVEAGLAIHSLRAAAPDVDRAPARPRRRLRRPDPHPRRRAAARGRRLPRRHRRAPDRVAGARRPARRALAARARDAPHAGEIDAVPPPAPASCCARAPRPTSATASPTCPAGSPRRRRGGLRSARTAT